MTTVVLNGNAYSDDGSSSRDMLNGGAKLWFFSLVADFLQEVISGQLTAAAAVAAAELAAAAAATSAQQAGDSAGASAASAAAAAASAVAAAAAMASAFRKGVALGTTSLDTLGDAASEGMYFQEAAGDATTGRGYPVNGLVGSLVVMRGPFGCQQLLVWDTGTAVRIWARRLSAAWTGSGPWTAWHEVTDYANLQNRPTLGTAAALNVPATPATAASGTQVVRGDDPRLGDAARRSYRDARTSNVMLDVDDSGNWIDITSGTFTQTFDTAANLAAGWWVRYSNLGSGDITLDPAGGETISGRSSFVMYPGEVRLIFCTGAGFESIVINGFRRAWVTSGTFVKPPGYRRFRGDMWGGGSGGWKVAAGTVVGGNGGAWMPIDLDASAIGDTLGIVIGAGGLGATTDGGFGTVGGATSLTGLSNFVANGAGNTLGGFATSPFADGKGGSGTADDNPAEVPRGGGGAPGFLSGSTTERAGGKSRYGGAGGGSHNTTSGEDGQVPGGGGGGTKTGARGGNGGGGMVVLEGVI